MHNLMIYSYFFLQTPWLCVMDLDSSLRATESYEI